MLSNIKNSSYASQQSALQVQKSEIQNSSKETSAAEIQKAQAAAALQKSEPKTQKTKEPTALEALEALKTLAQQEHSVMPAQNKTISVSSATHLNAALMAYSSN